MELLSEEQVLEHYPYIMRFLHSRSIDTSNTLFRLMEMDADLLKTVPSKAGRYYIFSNRTHGLVATVGDSLIARLRGGLGSEERVNDTLKRIAKRHPDVTVLAVHEEEVTQNDTLIPRHIALHILPAYDTAPMLLYELGPLLKRGYRVRAQEPTPSSR
jgi:hypothetical protein